MSLLKAAGMLATLVTMLLQKGTSIPATHARRCSFSEPLVLSHGDTLQLECGSFCSGPSMDDSTKQFKWSKRVLVSDSLVDLKETTGPLFTLEGAMFRDGGEYTCQCGETGKQCFYNVSVIPKMIFESSDKFVHYGDTFDLSCTLVGYPTNFSRIFAKQSGKQLTHQMQKRVNQSSTRTYVPVFEPDGEQYVCEAESYFGGELVAHIREEVTVNIYNPPSIIYTTEFVISNEKEFGKTGQLVCTVQSSPDTDSYVSWFANGSEIGNDTKYSTVTLPTEDGEIFRYKLIVSDLQESDIGSYLCRLSSSYGVEDVQEAWIQVDYRKDSEAVGENGSSHAHLPTERTFGGPSTGQSNVLFFTFCGLLVVIAMVMVWKISIGQRSRSYKRRRPSPPHIKYQHGNEEAVTPVVNTLRKHC